MISKFMKNYCSANGMEARNNKDSGSQSTQRYANLCFSSTKKKKDNLARKKGHRSGHLPYAHAFSSPKRTESRIFTCWDSAH
jgi:hypothetical protein